MKDLFIIFTFMNPYSDRITQIQQTIAQANLCSPHPETAVRLLAVSKTKPSRDWPGFARHFPITLPLTVMQFSCQEIPLGPI